MEKERPMNNHCCDTMDRILQRGMSALEYSAPIRSYRILEFYKGKVQIIANGIRYCPWCGTKLPKSLYDKQEEILENEYKLTDTWEGGEHYDLVPEEFKTDEWWKKRGL